MAYSVNMTLAEYLADFDQFQHNEPCFMRNRELPIGPYCNGKYIDPETIAAI